MSTTVNGAKGAGAASEKVSAPVGESYIGAIDQGTTSSRFLIFNKDGDPVASHQIEFKQYYPHRKFPSYLMELAL